MFDEFSMIDPGPLARYVGFTEDEISDLCKKYQMDMAEIEDDVLTLLVHLGYVSYDYDSKTVKIPNEEVRAEYVNSVAASEWGEVSKSLKIQQTL